MKSNVIIIDNHGNGFEDAINETLKAADYSGLDSRNALRLRIVAEEMMSLMRSVTGEMSGEFWVESDNSDFCLHLTTQTEMDKEKRYNLISSSTSEKNEAAKGFLGRLRNAFENAIADEVYHEYYEVPDDLWNDVGSWPEEDPYWDGYEKSILKKLADDIKICIRGRIVELTVSTQFDK